MRTVSIPREQIFQGPLVLVNRAHPLHEKEQSALTSVDPHHPDILLESRARQLLSACIQKAGGQREIVPVSGWRSQQEQQRIWDDSMAEHGETFTRQYVALPGCSEHQTGLAIDLGKAAGYIDFIRPAFPYDGVCGRFRRLAARYGFIERYQRGKEEVTGISAEPWHFRYVGAPHAQLMETNGLCLEEYRDFLRQGPRSVALENGRMAQVFYVPAAGAVTEVEVPEGCCQISGDNVEGFSPAFAGLLQTKGGNPHPVSLGHSPVSSGTAGFDSRTAPGSSTAPCGGTVVPGFPAVVSCGWAAPCPHRGWKTPAPA